MAARCQTSEYFDMLLQSCTPCELRCPKLPSECRNPCTVPTNSTVLFTEVPPMSVGITQTKGVASPMITNDITYIIWLLLALFVLIIPSVLFITFMLKRRQKLQRDSFGDASDKINNNVEINLKGEDLESVKIPVSENQDVEYPAFDNICGKALSDYLFPLPAVEEGAAILVTTKTSACFNPGPGVRGNAFVEI